MENGISINGLKDARVLITAGAAGIGRVIAELFARSGARIHVCDVDQAAMDEFRDACPEVGVTRADVSNEDEVDKLFEIASKSLGGLDVLINNAGIAGPTGLLETLDLADWNRTFAVNVTGQFLCARRAIPLLKKGHGGSIVNMSSAAGRLGFPGRSPYSASKWAVVGLTKTLAMELGSHNIRVNAVLPGAVDGPRIRKVIEDKAASLGKPVSDVFSSYTRQNSMERLIPQGDVAAVVAFLCTASAGSISGQAINVDGDTQSLT